MSAGVCAVYRRDLRRGEAESAPCARQILYPANPANPANRRSEARKACGV